MIPLIEIPPGLGDERIDGIELQQLHARVAQRTEEVLGRAQCTHRVIDDRHPHTFSPLRDQGLGEAAPQIVAVEDVRFQVDVVARSPDGLEHVLVGGGPVLQ